MLKFIKYIKMPGFLFQEMVQGNRGRYVMELGAV